MGAPAVRVPGQGRASHHQRSDGNIAGGVRHFGEAAGDDRGGIESYPSPSIGTNRKSNLSYCFRESLLSTCIVDLPICSALNARLAVPILTLNIERRSLNIQGMLKRLRLLGRLRAGLKMGPAVALLGPRQ